MSTVTDSLRSHNQCGYTLSSSSVTTNILLYADDACLVANGPASGQHLLTQVGKWLDWTGMRAKIPKCYSLAIQASTAKRFDPNLQLYGQPIPVVGNKSIKFLGGPISIPSNGHEHRQKLEAKMKEMMQRVDKSAVTRKQKLLLYKAGVCPRLNWDLAFTDLPISWLRSVLEAAVTKHLKKWSGLARSADTARLYRQRRTGV